jgi:Zn-dependent protease with chaperone function
MNAGTSFRLCVAISAMPLIPLALGSYHFVIVRTSDPSHPPIADLCLIAYERSIDAAGHVAIFLVALLLVFSLARWIAVLSKGWHETNQITRLQPLAAAAPDWSRVHALPASILSRARVVLVDAEEPFAVTVGYLTPRVLVSTGLLRSLNGAEFEAVVRHEAAHVRRRDPLRLLISDGCQTALPFVPLVAGLARTFRVRKELEADAETIAAMGSPAPLASALSNVLVAMSGPCPAGAGLSPTEARIDALLGRPSEQTGRSLLFATIVSAPALAFLSIVLYVLASSPHLTPIHICPS